MGYSISWIASRSQSKERLLAATGLVDTGESDDANDAPVSGATLPTGWYVMFLNDVLHPFVSLDALIKFSRDCEILGCQAEEHVMASAAFFYHRGKRVWNVVHEANKGIYHLEVDGAPPALLDQVRDGLIKRQDNEEGAGASVDFVWEIPIELAFRICGYRHDRWKFDWGRPHFTRLMAQK